MDPALKKQIIAAAIGLVTGVLGTYAMVWRDVAVIKSEISHIQADVSVIQTFIANDDPKAFIAAKNAIKDHVEGKQ
jgi:hypothetical protein